MIHRINNLKLSMKLATLSLLSVLLLGCSAFNFDGEGEGLSKRSKDDEKKSLLDLIGQSKSEAKSQIKANNRIRWDGQGVVLGEIDGSAFSSETFLHAVSDLVENRRTSTIRNLVRKYPDVALTVLQEANPLLHDSNALQAIAREFDSLWCNSNSTNSNGNRHWQTYLVDLTGSARKKGSLLDLKNRFWSHLKRNEQQEALDLKLVNSLPRETDIALSGEFYRLEAIALMMNNQFEEAIQRLRQSNSLIEKVSPYQSARLQLLLGEFYRHSGQLDLWKKSWAESVTIQANLLAREKLLDPSYWNRAAFLRPAGFDWPDESINNLKRHIGSLGIEHGETTKAESIVWLATGLQNNSRNEGQNAVLAFKKSEAACSDNSQISQLRLFQARAMMLAGQPGAASAILIRLISENQSNVLANRAQAILGAMKLQNGAIGQGVNLLKNSMDNIDAWPQSERLRAQADYGLAMLVSGHEDEGLKVLDQVQSEFEATGQIDQAAQCLWNKAKYFEKTEQKQRFANASAELSDIEKRFQ